MVKKKRWITALVCFALCTSLVIVYASMRSNTPEETAKTLFSDVSDSDWFFSDVRYVQEKGLMSGTGETVFSPNETMTRAMVVTVLWRLEGQPDGGATAFRDVKSDAYYYAAVAWASANKIVSGYDESTFGAADNVTREQLAAILYRYAAHKGYAGLAQADLGKFSDAQDISAYAIEPLRWAVADGLITGTSESTISPQGNALRCQVAAILRRFCERYTAGTPAQPQSPEQTADTGKTGGGQGTPAPHSEDAHDAHADDPLGYITIESATAAPGDTVSIAAKINHNPGILGMTLFVNYDSNNLTLESAENGEATNRVLEMTTSKTLFSGARFVWDGIEIKPEEVQDGAFLILQFRIPDNAKAGKYPITLHYTRGDIVDNNLDSIDLPIETGYITIQ